MAILLLTTVLLPLVGAIVLGERRRIGVLRRLITEKTDVSAYAERLLEEDFSLEG